MNGFELCVVDERLEVGTGKVLGKTGVLGKIDGRVEVQLSADSL